MIESNPIPVSDILARILIDSLFEMTFVIYDLK